MKISGVFVWGLITSTDSHKNQMSSKIPLHYIFTMIGQL